MKKYFPDENEIPEDVKPGSQKQTEYLINGEIKKWRGPFQEVLSQVFLKKNGKLEQVVLGEYPKLTQNEAMEAATAAEQAFDNGRGLWPTMSVRRRIKHVERY